MSRNLRIQYPGAIYHVTSRGNQGSAIVRDDEDRGQFWRRIGETVVKYGWEMFAAVLMTNHLHLFFRTPQPNLSRGMQHLLSGYAHWWNRRHQTVGHVFQGRFRGHLIENESYFWTVSRYVHLNPVPVLVSHPADWPWSTYAGYSDSWKRWDWVAYDTLLGIWQGTFGGPQAIDAYRSFVEGSGDKLPPDPFAEAVDGWILGSQEFAERIRQQLQPVERRPTLAQPLRIEELITTVCQHFDLPKSQLAARCSRHPARPIFASLARRFTDATLRELALHLGVARADSVPHLVARAAHAAPDSEISRSLHQIEHRLRR